MDVWIKRTKQDFELIEKQRNADNGAGRVYSSTVPRRDRLWTSILVHGVEWVNIIYTCKTGLFSDTYEPISVKLCMMIDYVKGMTGKKKFCKYGNVDRLNICYSCPKLWWFDLAFVHHILEYFCCILT